MPASSTTAASAAVFPPSSAQDNAAPLQPVCVMSFNAHDASGALGLAADALTLASMGVHPVTVVCGVHSCDTRRIFAHQPLDDELLAEQARYVLEDMAVHAFKIGFVGNPANIRCIAEICSDYPEIPVISYMPDLSWWQQGDGMEAYLDAFEDLLLPQTAVLVGNHTTLTRWLLPDWQASRPPGPRDLAQMAQEHDVACVLATGIEAVGGQLDNVLATAESVIGSGRFTQLPATYLGAGDTVSAALAALLAAGHDAGTAALEALEYMDHSLAQGFRPGMGHHIGDRMFWAQGPEEQEPESTTAPDD